MLIVTIAALVMAASLGWFAYRLLQDEQRRSDARVQLLTAALEADAPSHWDPPVRPTPATPTPTPTPLPALVYLEDDTRQVRAFRSEHEPEPETHVWQMTTEPDLADTGAVDEAASRPSGLFADVPAARRGDARGAIALGGVVLVALIAVGYALFGRPTPAPVPAGATSTEARTAPASVPAAAGGMPLELLSLSHEQRNGVLVVRGRVRNPVAGSDRSGVVASVMLLDVAGGFLGSARTPLETTRLRPGDEVGFVAELPSHKDVRRYRVTFRGVDGALVPHADRRAGRP
ncbi:hypothetical protein [Luteitalea sp.]